MNKSNESLEKTLKFPFPITEDEIEGKFFDYLRRTLPCYIIYGRDPRKKKGFSFKGIIRKLPGSHIIMANLRFNINDKAIEFETLKYDNVGKKKQLEFIDKIEEKTQEYFSQRLK